MIVPKLSAVICTHNRAHLLQKTIDSLIDQELTPDQYEILIIDNGSADNTREIVGEYFSHVSNLRYRYEPVIGLNRARNTGWQNAHGQYIAYIDDDAIACPQWLSRMLEAFENVKPKPGCVGGKIEPIWEDHPPAWLSNELAIYLAILDLSITPIVSFNQQVLAGANMGIQRSILEDLGGFQPFIDRKGTNLLSNGDILMQLQIMKSGYSCYYDPQISVKHHIHSKRLNKNWFLRRMYWEGFSKAIADCYVKDPKKRERLKLLILSMSRIFFSFGKLIRRQMIMCEATRFEWLCSNLMEIGYSIYVLGIWSRQIELA